MSIRFYDEALSNKIAKWVKDPNVRILKPDESSRLFEMTLDERKDQALTLPLIAISRDREVSIINSQKQPKTYSGFNVGNNQNSESIVLLNAIPMQLSYQIDIYTRYLAEADEYVRNFVFNFINYPKLVIEIPYNGVQLHHQSLLHLENSIIDNSDIKEHLFADQFTRFTLKLTIADAYMFSAPVTEVSRLDNIGNFQVIDRYTGEVVEHSEIKFCDDASEDVPEK